MQEIQAIFLKEIQAILFKEVQAILFNLPLLHVSVCLGGLATLEWFELDVGGQFSWFQTVLQETSIKASKKQTFKVKTLQWPSSRQENATIKVAKQRGKELTIK